MLFSGSEAAVGILSLSKSTFWHSLHRRELLYLLSARWGQFSIAERVKLERRILEGPPPYRRETKKEHAERNIATVVAVLGWLDSEQCALSTSTLTKLATLRPAVPHWKAARDSHAADSLDGRGGYIATDADPSKLLGVPLPDIISLAEQHTGRAFDSFTHYKPFEGLVQKYPRRAVLTLTYGLRHSRYQTGLWQTALSSWPAEASPRLLWTFAYRVLELPAEVYTHLAHDIGRWMKNQLPGLARCSLDRALSVWDRVVELCLQAGTAATQSALGETRGAGIPEKQSRRTWGHSANAPIGNMAEALFTILADLELKKNTSIPRAFTARLERLFQAAGEAADHAVAETTVRLRWLYFIDQEWVVDTVVPFFREDHPLWEPAWNGFSFAQTLPQGDLFTLLKADFLRALPRAVTLGWTHGERRTLHQFLTIGCFWHLKDARYVNYAEVRRVLQKVDDEGRSDALWCLDRIIREQHAWTSFGKPFLKRAWPKERRFQNDTTSRGLLEIVENSANRFPEVVATVLPFLTEVSHLDLFLRHSANDSTDAESLASKFPEPMLALLDRVVARQPRFAPYGLSFAVDAIASSRPALRQDHRWRRIKAIADGVA